MTPSRRPRYYRTGFKNSVGVHVEVPRDLVRRPRGPAVRGLPGVPRPRVPRGVRRPPADMAALATLGRPDNTAFVEEWDEETGDHDLRGGPRPLCPRAPRPGRASRPRCCSPTPTSSAPAGSPASPFGSGLGSGGGVDPAKVRAGARAHNRWLADFCATNPQRRSAWRSCRSPRASPRPSPRSTRPPGCGLRGIMIPTRWFEAPAYLDTSYDPVWAACAEAGLVNPHPFRRGPGRLPVGPGFLPSTPRRRGGGRPARSGCSCCRACSSATRLCKYSIAENGAWWVPDIVQRMNKKWDGAHNTRKFGDAFRLDLSMRPGDYVDRNCLFAASTPGADEIERRHAIGVDNLLWGNDLPHPEGTYPHTRKWIAERFREVPRGRDRQDPRPDRRRGLPRRRRRRSPTSSTASAPPGRTSTADRRSGSRRAGPHRAPAAGCRSARTVRPRRPRCPRRPAPPACALSARSRARRGAGRPVEERHDEPHQHEGAPASTAATVRGAEPG